MDWNHNGKQDPADDIIDMKLSESDTEPAGSSSGRPNSTCLRFDIWLPVIYLGLLLPGGHPDQRLHDDHRPDLCRAPCAQASRMVI